MTRSRAAGLTCAVVLTSIVSSPPARSVPPVPDVVRDADIAIGYDARSRCPDLMHADAPDRTAALVLFLAGPTGVPARASIRSSSGPPSLDAAAVSCVQRLRFLPAVHVGDGNAVDSWQQIAWKWGRSHSEAPAAPAAPVSTGPPASAVASAPAAATVRAAGAGGAPSAEARVCPDAQGRPAQQPVITRSSGDAAVDAAALNAARSAAAAHAAGVHCLRVIITPEDTTVSTREAP